ncbi:MAG: PAS domain S-box protein, partial [bacterium]
MERTLKEAETSTNREKKMAIRRSEETAEVFLKACHEAALLIDSNHIVLAMNDAAGRLFETRIGDTVRENVPGFASAAACIGEPPIATVKTTGEPLHFGSVWKGRRLDNTLWPIPDGHGNAPRIAVFCRDVTERWQAQQTAPAEPHDPQQKRPASRPWVWREVAKRLRARWSIPARARKKLMESEERFRNLSQSSIVGVLVRDHAGKPLFCNRALAEIFGYDSPAEIMAIQDTGSLVAPHDRDRVASYFEGRKSSREVPASYEYQGLRKDGSLRWILNNVSVVEWEGRPASQVVSVDISQRKLLEEDLRASEARTQAVLDAGPDSMFRLSREGVVLDFKANPEEPCLTGKIGPGDKIGDAVPPDIAATMEVYIQKTLQSGVLQKFEYQLPGQNGRRHFEARLVESGLNEVLFIVRDITERKRAEDSLKEAEERARAISTSANDAIIMIDDGGRVTFWNPAAERTFGFKEKEIVGKQLDDLVIPEAYRDAHRKGVEQFQKRKGGGKFLGPHQTCGKRKNGEEFPLELSLGKVQIHGRSHAIGVVRDITDRKKQDEERARLAAAVEHAAEIILITDTEEKILYVN